MKIVLMAACTALMLGGCASTAQFNADVPKPEGPQPQLTLASYQSPLACVASHLTHKQKQRTFGVLDFPDKTGTENRVGNDSFGTFNTQGAADMLAASLKRGGVRLIELGPSFRVIVDWSTNKSHQGQLKARTLQQTTNADNKIAATVQVLTPESNIVFPEIGLFGSITTTDIMPGGGIQGGAYGVVAGYEQNRILTSIDLRAVIMPRGKIAGGEVIASTTVEKQVVQDNVQLSLARYFGPVGKPTLVQFDIGGARREPLKYSTRAMVDLALADVLAQVFKISGCTDGTVPEVPLTVAGK